jgi:ketosteroid isomerase-like protein
MGVDLETLQAWTDRYVEAWRSGDADAIGSIFAPDARYFTHPFRQPREGREAIVQNWTGNPDPPGSWTCDYRALAVNGSTGVIRGHTSYLKDDGSVDTEFANIFIAEFDDEGLCYEFTEWFMESNPPARA